MATDRRDVQGNDGQRSLGTLLRDLAEGSTTLVRQEVRLARLEFASLFRSIGTGTAYTDSWIYGRVNACRAVGGACQ